MNQESLWNFLIKETNGFEMPVLFNLYNTDKFEQVQLMKIRSMIFEPKST